MKRRLILTVALLLAATAQLNAQIYIIRWYWTIGGGGGGWTPTRGFELALQGDYAFVANMEGGLHILTVTNPQAIRWISSIQTGGQARGVAVSGNYAYLADDTNGLQVIDVSNPALPTRVGGLIPTNGTAHKVFLSGNRAYLADGGKGLQIIDVSNPATPSRIGGFDTDGFAVDVLVDGDYAYVADLASGLKVINVSDPNVPVVVGSLATTNAAEGVTLTGSYAFVAAGYAGSLVVDVSNPALPAVVGVVGGRSYALSTTIVGNYAFQGSGTYLCSYDISNPSTPVVLDCRDQGSGHAYGVAVSGNNAFVSTPEGLVAYDTITRTNIVQIGGFDLNGRTLGVAVSGNYAYIANDEAGMALLDVSDPATARVVGRVDTSHYAKDVATSGNFAYVADDYDGLKVMDVSNPYMPNQVGHIFLGVGAYATDVSVVGNYAYVAARGAGFKVVDISNPTSPILAGTVTLPVSALYVAVASNHAYVATQPAQGYWGLSVIEISNPFMPQLVGSVYSKGEFGYGVAVSGSFAYVTTRDTGLQVVDVSEPTSPRLVRTMDTPGYLFGIDIAGTELYLTDAWYTPGVEITPAVHIFDLSNPETPAPLGTISLPDSPEARRIAVAGGRAYVTDPDRGLAILDVANNPRILQPAQSQTLMIKDTATFTIAAAGNGPLHYKWRRNGFPLMDGGRISGANTPTLTITGVHGADVGNYTVLVTNNYGSIVSFAPAVLTVMGPSLSWSPSPGAPLKLKFLSVAGVTYEVLHKTHLEDPIWSVRETLPGTGGVIEFTPQINFGPSGYFRLRVD